ncbi:MULTISPECIES: hypothetical protein [Pasteurella]|nr:MULTISPECIES: hypothetical protein [Pasteurella]MCT8984192.1 hypothetical protein [Pasteurella multocida]MDA5608618.1 hypothetical protein [Pasteurella multocida subsp. multocida]MDA5610136.1 hypothetical protein [Pasteurella multocida]MDA5612608.1 hypothetical protein [Pasteurella multocida]MDA5614538.1 hypothetical protein [Pasteurella multocida]
MMTNIIKVGVIVAFLAALVVFDRSEQKAALHTEATVSAQVKHA